LIHFFNQALPNEHHFFIFKHIGEIFGSYIFVKVEFINLSTLILLQIKLIKKQLIQIKPKTPTKYYDGFTHVPQLKLSDFYTIYFINNVFFDHPSICEIFHQHFIAENLKNTI